MIGVDMQPLYNYIDLVRTSQYRKPCIDFDSRTYHKISISSNIFISHVQLSTAVENGLHFLTNTRMNM